MPSPPPALPGAVRAIRIILFSVAGLMVAGAAVIVVIGLTTPLRHGAEGVLWLVVAILLGAAAGAAAIALRVRRGRVGARVAISVLGGLLSLLAVSGLVHVPFGPIACLLVGVPLLVLANSAPAARHFHRTPSRPGL